ncbi:hypothetical protein [Promicromonospora sukumoe]|uniref:hypothetical protein n=1 Tax=Promicromonospora sukumoe TaxID=88382 RepID=UPI00036AB8BD|nr:hypothetical protein [Promicromonospora sukumoe]
MALRERRLRPARGSVATENHALLSALVALAVGLVAAIVVFAGDTVPLFGGVSAGLVAAVASGVSGAAAFCAGYVRSSRTPRLGGEAGRGAGRWRRGFDAVVLTVTAAGIVVLLTASAFAVFDLAFRELRLDALMAAVLVGLSAAVAAYVLTLVSVEVTSIAIANLLALFLVSGALASMLSANDPHWWQVNFSALGVGGGFSAYAFNITLIFAGLAMTTLTHYVIGDLRTWATAPELRRLEVLRTWLIGVAVLLVGLGWVTVEVAKALHTVIASVMTVLFAGLIVATPYLVPRLPRSFLVTSSLFVSVFALVVLLMWPVGYFNLTAVEFLGFFLLLTWLFLFVRTVAACLQDARAGDRPEPVDAGPVEVEALAPG